MTGIGIQLHQVIAKTNGKTVYTWTPRRDRTEAEKLVAKLRADDAADGYSDTEYSIFSADADFFA
jgi:hypothetical protein